jgi:hypothetical protein
MNVDSFNQASATLTKRKAPQILHDALLAQVLADLRSATPYTPAPSDVFAHVEDFVEAFIGPFPSVTDAKAHVQMTADLLAAHGGHGATYHGAICRDHFPADPFIIDPADDLRTHYDQAYQAILNGVQV